MTLDVLDRFVLRARRVEAHSLTRDRDALKAMGRFSMTGHIGLEGSMMMRRSLPDEEIFESLAARVRPVLLKSESIYYAKVLDAIEDRANGADVPVDADDPIRAGLAQLRKQWSQFDTDTDNVLGFALQSSSLDGSDVTPQVSDTQLAAAWLYGDLVHVDVKGKKSEGQLFPVKERFSAAVTYFANVADLVLATLDVLKKLDEFGVLGLDTHVLTEDVVVGVDELVDEATAFFGPVDAPMPDLDMVHGEIPSGFKQFTVVDLLRQNPSNQVEVVLADKHEDVLAQYDAAVNARNQIEDRFFWRVLIENVTEIEVSFAVTDQHLDDIRLETIESHASTNRMMLAGAVLQQQMAQAASATFLVAGRPFFILGFPPVADEELKFVDISVDTLSDLVRIEQIVGRALKPLKGSYSNEARVRLRRARLLWEGKLVQYGAGPMKVTAPAGIVPKVIAIADESFAVGEVEVPFPKTLLRHPSAVITSTSSVPDSDPPAESMVFAAPEGDVFVAWAADKRAVLPGDDLNDAVSWDLSHLDQGEFLFGR